MSPLNLLSALETCANENSAPRTVESVRDALILQIAGSGKISGRQDYGQSILRIQRAFAEDPRWTVALQEMAHLILELFPEPAAQEPNAVQDPGPLYQAELDELATV